MRKYLILLLFCLVYALVPSFGYAQIQSFDKIPSMTVLIGDVAYDLDYANDPANVDEILEQLEKTAQAGQGIYIKDLSGSWIDNEDSKEVQESSIAVSKVIYKDSKGITSQFEKMPETEEFMVIAID